MQQRSMEAAQMLRELCKQHVALCPGMDFSGWGHGKLGKRRCGELFSVAKIWINMGH